MSWKPQGLSRSVMGLLYLYLQTPSLNSSYRAENPLHLGYENQSVIVIWDKLRRMF